jgi:uncharacterized protein YjbJ (UPF0337 family)
VAGIIDKIKGMLGGRPKPGVGGEAQPSAITTLKEKAGDVKDKVDVLVDKVGEKVPPKVKDAYEKVSDKVEEMIPGRKDADAPEPPEATGADAAVDSAADNPYADPDGATPAN